MPAHPSPRPIPHSTPLLSRNSDPSTSSPPLHSAPIARRGIPPGPARKPASSIPSASASTTSSTSSALALAQAHGITPDQFAAERAKLMKLLGNSTTAASGSSGSLANPFASTSTASAVSSLGEASLMGVETGRARLPQVTPEQRRTRGPSARGKPPLEATSSSSIALQHSIGLAASSPKPEARKEEAVRAWAHDLTASQESLIPRSTSPARWANAAASSYSSPRQNNHPTPNRVMPGPTPSPGMRGMMERILESGASGAALQPDSSSSSSDDDGPAPTKAGESDEDDEDDALLVQALLPALPTPLEPLPATPPPPSTLLASPFPSQHKYSHHHELTNTSSLSSATVSQAELDAVTILTSSAQNSPVRGGAPAYHSASPRITEDMLVSPPRSRRARVPTSVFDSPDMERVLRKELLEMERRGDAGGNKLKRNLMEEDYSSSSPFPVHERDSSYSSGPAAKRARDVFSDPSSVLPTSEEEDDDRESLHAPSFCDSSPALSERTTKDVLPTAASQNLVASPTEFPGSDPVNADFYHAHLPSSSPTSSTHSYDDSAYRPPVPRYQQQHQRVSPGPSNSTMPSVAPHSDPQLPVSRRPTLIQRSRSSAAATSSSAVASTSSNAVRQPLACKMTPNADGSFSKPTWSYAALIGQAIFSADQHKISLADIYTFIMVSYPYYKKGDTGWQNSIRHNLSLNECFVKTARGADNPGKGCLWAVKEGCEEQFRDGGFVKKGAVASGSGGGRKGKSSAPTPPSSSSSSGPARTERASSAARYDPSGLLRSNSKPSLSKRPSSASVNSYHRASSPAHSYAGSTATYSDRGNSPAPSLGGGPTPIKTHGVMRSSSPAMYSPALSYHHHPEQQQQQSVLPFDNALQPRYSSHQQLRIVVDSPTVHPDVHDEVQSPMPLSAGSSVGHPLLTDPVKVEVSDESMPPPSSLAPPPRPASSSSAPGSRRNSFSSASSVDEPSSSTAFTAPAPLAAPIPRAPSAAPDSQQQPRLEPAYVPRRPQSLPPAFAASPPTSVYHRLAGEYRPLSYTPSTAAAVHNSHRKLAILASPEAGGIMPVDPAIYGDERAGRSERLKERGRERDETMDRIPSQNGGAHFLPAPHIFPGGNGAGGARRRADGAEKEGVVFPSSFTHTQSPVSSVRGGSRAPMSPVQTLEEMELDAASATTTSHPTATPSGDPKVTTTSDPEKKRTSAISYHLPAVVALADHVGSGETFRTPPRIRSPSSRSASATHTGGATPGYLRRPWGNLSSFASPGGEGLYGWGDPFTGRAEVEAELESWRGEVVHGSGSSSAPPRFWSPRAHQPW